MDGLQTRVCPRCTLENEPHAVCCAACEGTLDSRASAIGQTTASSEPAASSKPTPLFEPPFCFEPSASSKPAASSKPTARSKPPAFFEPSASSNPAASSKPAGSAKPPGSGGQRSILEALGAAPRELSKCSRLPVPGLPDVWVRKHAIGREVGPPPHRRRRRLSRSSRARPAAPLESPQS